MIEREQAIAIARERAEANGWGFADPVDAVFRRGWFGSASRFQIETNAGRRGTKAIFVIDAASGKILREGYIPR
jgi:hypothetical protein